MTRRALLVSMDLPPTRGGIQTMAREILERAHTFEYTVVGPGVVLPGGARLTPWPLGRRGMIPAVARAASRALRIGSFDVVLALHANAALAGALRSAPPQVVFCHGGELRSPLIRRVAGAVYPRAAAVIANSRFTRSEVIALGVDAGRVTVLPVGAPEAVPDVAVAGKGRRTVLTVARLVPHKGVDALLRAAAKLPGDVAIVVVGDGPERDALERLARSLGIGDRVTFEGALDDDALRGRYAHASVYAQLSRATASGFEGGGIAMLEAATYGLPIVAGRTGAIPETITDGVNGLLVDPDDTDGVAGALQRALTDGAGLGERAREMAQGERSWARFVERLEEMLEAVAQRGRAS